MQNLIIIVLTSSDWVNTITASAALITAFIALKTVIEIRKQREHSYHPDINIANFEFYVYKYENEEYEDEEPDDTTYLYYSKSQLDENKPITGYNELVFDMNNIGFGVAKEVTWHWSFDFIGAKNAIRLSKDEFEFDAKDTQFFIKYPKFKVDWIISVGEDNASDYFNFILPYSIENRKNEIRLPNYFMQLYWLFKVKDMMVERLGEDERFPPLKLNVYYKDMDGKKISKTFYFFLAYSFVSNPAYAKKELGKFRFEIVEQP